MDEATKATIDGMDYEGMLRRWRFAPAGDPMFQGEPGEYFLARMVKMEGELPKGEHVLISKRVGWTQDMRKEPRLNIGGARHD